MSIPSDKRECIVPASTQVMYDAYHYAQANRVGNIVWVSGQVGLDAQMQPGKTVQEQAELAFQALAQVLETAGGGLCDVVELTTFHTSLRADMEVFAQVKDRYFKERYPAWTAVGITELALPELKLEVRAVAVIGSGSC